MHNKRVIKCSTLKCVSLVNENHYEKQKTPEAVLYLQEKVLKQHKKACKKQCIGIRIIVESIPINRDFSMNKIERNKNYVTVYKLLLYTASGNS